MKEPSLCCSITNRKPQPCQAGAATSKNGTLVLLNLFTSNSEHFSATYRAYTLSCRLTILHDYALSVLDFPFLSALQTVGCCHDSLLSLGFNSRRDATCPITAEAPHGRGRFQEDIKLLAPVSPGRAHL